VLQISKILIIFTYSSCSLYFLLFKIINKCRQSFNSWHSAHFICAQGGLLDHLWYMGVKAVYGRLELVCGNGAAYSRVIYFQIVVVAA
jgi:hypothetical protein